uniref:Putative venom gland protein n=1 Tax=Megacormus gertschi TaxID=1843536 RepID=A0A224XG57_9SCOR
MQPTIGVPSAHYLLRSQWLFWRKMASKFYLISFVMLGVFMGVLTLRCRECGTYKCEPPPDNCPVGTVTNVCDCCLVCGKAENEQCGGVWNMNGKCGTGLKCIKDSEPWGNGICQKTSKY